MTSQYDADVIIIGGGPLGLCAAYYCAVKRNMKVLLIEQFTFESNIYGSSVGFGRQFRTCYSQKNMCQLAIEAISEWEYLKTKLNNPHLLNQTGCLWLGDSTVHSSEGNIEEAVKNLKELGQEYELIKGKDKIISRFPFIAGAVDGIESRNAVALFMKNGAVINVPSLVKSVKSALESSSHCTLMEQTKVTRIDYSDIQMIKVSTDKCQTFIGKKAILTPGAYINEVLPSLSPMFPYLIQMKIYLWVSTYFKIRDSVQGKDSPSEWPLWYFFGHPKEHKSDAATDYNLYYGFPCDGDDEEGYARVAPAFTSNEKWNFDNFPPPPVADQRKVDKDALHFTSCFVQQSMKDLEDTPNPEKTATCIACFAELTSGQPDDAGAGFVLDFVPDTDRRIVLTAGGWGMKFATIFGKILSDLASEGHTSYQDLIHPMNINRGVLIKEQVKTKGVNVTCATEQAVKFHRIWM